jgi:hypothetical protein
MTRWLEAAKAASPPPTKPILPTKRNLGLSGGELCRVLSVKSEGGEGENRTPPTAPAAPRADGLDADAGALLDFLRQHGPTSYGAAASSLGWGCTRAWQAEARLRAAGMVTMGPLGQAVPVTGTCPPGAGAVLKADAN